MTYAVSFVIQTGPIELCTDAKVVQRCAQMWWSPGNKPNVFIGLVLYYLLHHDSSKIYKVGGGEKGWWLRGEDKEVRWQSPRLTAQRMASPTACSV